jgi:hypothetical protein
MDILLYWGIPTAITGLIFGIILFIFKRDLNKRDRLREERETNTEKLMLMIMQNGRAAVVLAEATARAVQRIPDAHCNGDMTEALKRAEQIQKEEQEFLLDQGIQHIFGNN